MRTPTKHVTKTVRDAQDQPNRRGAHCSLSFQNLEDQPKIISGEH